MSSYQSLGTICVNESNLTYALCEIEYCLNADGTYKYIFKPNYSVTELPSAGVFQGIPGLDLDLRKDAYIRENRLPTFISERVPSENREDYFELLEKVNMEYMDPIEYLIRTQEQYFGDSLFVIRKHEKMTVSFDDFNSHVTNASLIKKILEHICLGDDVCFRHQVINDSNRKIFHDVFLSIYQRSQEYKKEKQIAGVETAKKLGNYKGRKPVHVDTIQFIELQDKIEKGQMTSSEAAKSLGISIYKFYRFKNSLRNK